MMIVRFEGGLGNQLYQYALYLSLKRRYPNAAIKADLGNDKNRNHFFRHIGGYSLENSFGIKLDICTIEDKLHILYKRSAAALKIFSLLKRGALFQKQAQKKIERDNLITECVSAMFNPNIYCLDESKDYYFIGYWQNAKYKEGIENKLRSTIVASPILSQADTKLIEKIETSLSIAIHVRRGDYVTKERFREVFNICSQDYYEKAIALIQQKTAAFAKAVHYFLFSDDIEYCKESFSYLPNAEFISHIDSPIVDFYMISKCKHAIISNSTFSHWAAWLTDRNDKIVIYPRYHTRRKSYWMETSAPSHWIAVDNLAYSLVSPQEMPES